MLLAIDVGNTHTVLGLFDGDDLVEHWRIATESHRTADEIAVVLRGLLAQPPGPAGADVVDGVALCSTVPSVLHEMRDMIRRYYGDGIEIRPLAREDSSGISCAKAERLRGYSPITPATRLPESRSVRISSATCAAVLPRRRWSRRA